MCETYTHDYIKAAVAQPLLYIFMNKRKTAFQNLFHGRNLMDSKVTTKQNSHLAQCVTETKYQ